MAGIKGNSKNGELEVRSNKNGNNDANTMKTSGGILSKGGMHSDQTRKKEEHTVENSMTKQMKKKRKRKKGKGNLERKKEIHRTQFCVTKP